MTSPQIHLCKKTSKTKTIGFKKLDLIWFGFLKKCSRVTLLRHREKWISGSAIILGDHY